MSHCFDELSDGVITATITDQHGDPIPGSALSALMLTLRDRETFQVINSRDLLGASPMSVDEDGRLTLRLEATDNPIVNPRRQRERHQAILYYQWSDGRSHKGIEIEVTNLGTVGGSPDL